MGAIAGVEGFGGLRALVEVDFDGLGGFDGAGWGGGSCGRWVSVLASV